MLNAVLSNTWSKNKTFEDEYTIRRYHIYIRRWIYTKRWKKLTTRLSFISHSYKLEPGHGSCIWHCADMKGHLPLLIIRCIAPLLCFLLIRIFVSPFDQQECRAFNCGTRRGIDRKRNERQLFLQIRSCDRCCDPLLDRFVCLFCLTIHPGEKFEQIYLIYKTHISFINSYWWKKGLKIWPLIG